MVPMFQPNVSTLKSKRDVAGLVRIASAKDRRTRRAAIRALGEISDKSALPTLATILRDPATHPADRAEAASAIGLIGDADGIEPLVQACALSREREQQQLARANANPDPNVRPETAINMISSDEYLLRSTVMSALAKIGGELAIKSLFEILASETGPMQGSAKTACKAAIQEALDPMQPTYAPVLYDQLASPSADCRQYAAQCLGELGDASAVEYLIAIASNESEPFPVRQAAISGLGRIGDLRALPCLDDLSHSPQRGIARDAKYNATQIRQQHRPV